MTLIEALLCKGIWPVTEERAHEIAHIVVLLAAFVIAVAATLAMRLRTTLKLYRFAEEGQFRGATQAQIDAFLASCSREGRGDRALHELAEIRRLHGHTLKQGHLLWAQSRVMGRIPDGVQAPAFVPGDGVREAQERLGPVFKLGAIPRP